MSKIIIIAAIGANNELGYNNNLIWRIKEDLNFFKITTSGHIVVMGRKTYESIGKPLPNRTNIVLSSSMENQDELVIVRTIDELKTLIASLDEEVYIIGGSSLYEIFIQYADELILTEIDDIPEYVDTYFPNIESSWTSIVIGEYQEGELKYKRKIYTKK